MNKDEPVTSLLSLDVVTVKSDDKLSKVKRLMRDLLLHHLPVVEEKSLVGIISQVDVLKASFSNLSGSDTAIDDSLDSNILVRDIMTREVVSIKDSDSIFHAAKMLREYEFNSLPVVNAQQEVVGIVTSKDLIDYLVGQFQNVD